MSDKLSSVEIRVANRLAALRKEVGMTLRELAAKTGLSDAYLSRVENGRIAVTLASLEKLAEVFATPIATFFEEELKPSRLVICRRGKGQKVRFRGRSGTVSQLLAEEKHGKLMEPLIVDVSSATKPVEPLAHPGEEFNYVISGSCQFLFDGESHLLRQGDSVYFDATAPHAVHAIEDQECKLLAVVTSRDFQIHRNISKVLEGRIQA
ncbi:MAG TPA: cupin domain-containing protein [Opitutaceae bacterium]|nr:cupin domain-containing protein [Opitutaceae bacterium]